MRLKVWYGKDFQLFSVRMRRAESIFVGN